MVEKVGVLGSPMGKEGCYRKVEQERTAHQHVFSQTTLEDKETSEANSTDLSIVSLFFSSVEHYKHHWFPEKPCKGSGYRCIRINHKMDPLIGQAAQRIGLSSQELFRLLPSELTLWVDPYEVSYRIGEDGSICVLYEASPAGGSTQNSTNVQMVDSRISCKEELLLGRTSPSKNYNMMTVSG
ncbi:protein BTG1 [Marmota marmota marmota]|uniref:protein BTG1 n=1 Tax=Marmota marmota marmota TaxID=9994 RepID=UPI002092FDF6|nr:protein BTG1 [Marmota marmota marmota]